MIVVWDRDLSGQFDSFTRDFRRTYQLRKQNEILKRDNMITWWGQIKSGEKRENIRKEKWYAVYETASSRYWMHGKKEPLMRRNDKITNKITTYVMLARSQLYDTHMTSIVICVCIGTQFCMLIMKFLKYSSYKTSSKIKCMHNFEERELSASIEQKIPLFFLAKTFCL